MMREFLLAVSFLTRLPIPKNVDFKGLTLSQSAWAFPLAGAFCGLLAACVYNIATHFSLPPSLAGWLALGIGILLTGGLHEDGLADMADGLAHGRSTDEKLAIMKDSRIGTYGVIALVVTLALRAQAISIFESGYDIIRVLVATGACSRCTMVLLMFMYPPARPNGLAASAGTPIRRQVYEALLLAAASLLMLKSLSILMLGLLIMALVTIIVGKMAQNHFGGVTGDVIGASQQTCETLMLLMLSAAIR